MLRKTGVFVVSRHAFTKSYKRGCVGSSKDEDSEDTHTDMRTTARLRVFCEFMADAIRSRRDLIEGRYDGTVAA